MNMINIRDSKIINNNDNKDNFNKNNNNNPQFSKKQFIQIIEKRIRKHIRMNNLLEKNNIIYVIDDLTHFFIKRIITMPIKIINIKDRLKIKQFDYTLFSNKKIKDFSAKLKKDEILLLPLILDDYATLFLEEFFNNKTNTNNIINKNNKIQSLFETISYEEIIQIAEIFKINFKFNRKNDIYNFLDILEIKFKGSKHSLYKSVLYYKENVK